MLQDIHHMAQDANEFHHTVHSYFVSPQHVLAHLQHVNQWANTVDHQIYFSHQYSHVHHDWQHAMSTLRQINMYMYGPGGGNGGGHDGHPAPREALFQTLHGIRPAAR